ncbi:NHLP family bacteriocin export ABC transporter peptidase/permease/ATPase subunit [Butyrivibrio sp. JL13D10]|uniref:NHLP family bacteriocin export ABC transporter peptidase/permease/ATPase subunit n=1 Tax=Butyrivibrio sp. JL13D10 TaxID=3236815 RepID=UPI0038B49190
MSKGSNKKIKEPLNSGVAKVPVVMQMEALECGAACLVMIMAYYNKWIPLEQAREDCGISRDGSKASNIAKAARTYGFEAKGYRFEIDEIKKLATYPCIIHWNFDHFIVLNGFKNGKAYINDPARGEVILTEKEFDEGFTGVVLLFSPGEGFVPSGKKKSMIDFAKARMEGTLSAFTFVALTSATASLCLLISAGLSKFFMDYMLTGNNPKFINSFLFFIALITTIQIIVQWIGAVYSLRISGKFDAVGNATYFWHVLRLPMKFFSQRMAGDIEQRRLTNASIADVLVNTFAPLIINAAMLVFYLVFMIHYSAVMTLFGVIAILLNLYLSKVISDKRVNITRVQMRDQAKLYSTTVSGVEMIETIKSSGAENGFFRKWAGFQASVNAQNVKLLKLNEYIGVLPSIIMTLTDNIILIMGVYMVMTGRFTAGTVLAFQGLFARFLIPVSSFIGAGQSLQEMRTEMERIEDVMDYPLDPSVVKKGVGESEEDSRTKLSGRLSMHNISFGYSKLMPPIISDFNLELDPGKSVAFVGASGCGKSTLSKLISGLYQPWTGEILFDGKPASEIGRNVFTSSVAVVNQDVILFEDTIANNIKMWDRSIEDFEMILAARDAQIHEDVMQRDGGYQYKLSEGGHNFSGGQRQRIEIARILAQDPTLIVMDEATSALDAQTEYNVVKAIKNRGITCVVIAHRLSTVRDCDEIIVLDHGIVAERGTHNELMAKGGLYTKLVSSE